MATLNVGVKKRLAFIIQNEFHWFLSKEDLTKPSKVF